MRQDETQITQQTEPKQTGQSLLQGLLQVEEISDTTELRCRINKKDSTLSIYLLLHWHCVETLLRHEFIFAGDDITCQVC